MTQFKRRETLTDLYGEFSERIQGDHWQPAVDVFETEKEIVVRAEVPGVARRDLRVSVDRDVLRISGERRAPARSDLLRLHQVEIATGPFERRVRIALPFDRERVSAHLEEGVLTVSVPKRNPEKVVVRSE